MKLFIGIGMAAAGVVVGASIHALIVSKNPSKVTVSEEVAPRSSSSWGQPCPYSIKRLPGFSYIKPLVYAEPECESASYVELHAKLDSTIGAMKKQGIVSDASVYLRDFSRGEWLSVNDTNTFNPGSMLKLPLLLALVRTDEMTPGFLNQTLAYRSEKKPAAIFPQTFDSQTIVPLKQYSLRELAQAMIEHSDNIATTLLNQKVDDKIFQQVFRDLDLPAPRINDPFYRISARQVSVFLKAVYNASYLNIPNSERVGYLLTTPTFKQGICAGIPSEIGIAHKFGESGTREKPELHETALVYLPGSPYLITVMTRGAEIQKLPNVLAVISEVCYRFMERRSSNGPSSP